VSQAAPHNLSMRFIHTADWQIGMRAVHAGVAAAAVRSARIETAKNICRMAEAEAVDFLLLAGDTFENNAVDRALVEQVGAILASAGCGVYILPGNHDPLQPGSVWEHPVWGSSNVTVLRDPVPVAVPGGILFPCPLRVRRSDQDPTAWIPTASIDGSVRAIAAHGNVAGLIADEGGFPIPMDTAARTGADYVALGHWHSTVLYGGAARMAYSGTPEPTRFGEPDSGHALLVSIASQGAWPEIQVLNTAGLRWVQIAANDTITNPGKLADIARMLTQMPNQSRTLVEVVLKGLLFECDRDEIGRIETAGSNYLHCRLDRSGLRPAPDDHDWIGHLPSGAVQMAAERLKEAAAGRSADAETATQALLELYAFAQEVRK
jgi:DNA repair exonuclease SbcCD nuclease subunit